MRRATMLGIASALATAALAGYISRKVDAIRRVTLTHDPSALWVGVHLDHHRRDVIGPYSTLDIYTCVVPMFPLRVTVTLHDKAYVSVPKYRLDKTGLPECFTAGGIRRRTENLHGTR